MKHLILTVALLVLLSSGGISTFARAADPDYEINHIAFNSSFLDGDIAKAYDITRAENLAVVNISVVTAGEIGIGVAAVITGTTTNMINQVKPLQFREVREEHAIYYLANLRFDQGDMLTFKLDVKIEGETKPRRIEWQQRFWKH